MSGGRANLKQRRKRAGQFAAQGGDVVATHKDGHALIDRFCIDSKHWATFEIDAAAFGKRPGKLLDAWAKLSAEAARFKKWPMLIGRQNRKGEFLVLSMEGLSWLAKGLRPGTETAIRMTIPRTDSPSLFILGFDSLTKNVNFDLLRGDKKKPAASKRPRVQIEEE